MKLNFWQWLAVVLLVLGLAWWFYDSKHPKGTSSPTTTTTVAPAATAPTTHP